MTERLYYESDATEGRARIVRCTEEPDGRYAVEVDRTLFHPQGGGQPADKGWLADAEVEDVILRADNLLHIVRQPLSPGEVEMRLDADNRQINSRWHSAGHLVGYAGELYGWKPVKAHHWPGEGRVSFRAGSYAAVPGAGALVEHIEGWCEKRLVRHIAFENNLRNVRFGELAAYGCGGTHVKNLADIGPVLITGIKLKKGELNIRYALTLP